MSFHDTGPHVVVVIPTLDEKEATATIVERLDSLRAQQVSHHISVLYVDGGSGDGTLELLNTLTEQYAWLHLIRQSDKRGLGAAYAEGMNYAMSELKADFILEFDGDLQHKPDDIPQFLKCTEGYDYVIGTRFIDGGSIPDDWGLDRILLSKGGNLIARLALGAHHLHDITSGFKLSRVKGFLEEFDFSRLYSKRHAYKIHLLAFMLKRGARVKEVPIEFQAREAGESKLIKNDIVDTLRVLALIRLKGV